MSQLEFIEETHTYLLDGAVVPSVTQVLGLVTDFSGIPPQVLRAAADFGQAVHLATELYDLDDLDEESLDPALYPYLDAWKLFLAETSAEIIGIERRVYSAKHRYAGTLDRVIRINGKLADLDIKSTAAMPATVGLQTAAYQQANLETTGERTKARYAIRLLPTGKYSLVEFKERSDLNVFLSCLQIHNWRKNHGK